MRMRRSQVRNHIIIVHCTLQHIILITHHISDVAEAEEQPTGMENADDTASDDLDSIRRRFLLHNELELSKFRALGKSPESLVLLLSKAKKALKVCDI